MTAATLLAGVFVGGRGERLGGVAKGLLKAPGSEQTLLERLCAEIGAALPTTETVLVGAGAGYESSRLLVVRDSPSDIGPIGGLLGLLSYAQQRGVRQVLALACDLPRLERSLLSRLTRESPDAAAVLVETEGVRNPLIARYETARALDAAHAVLTRGKRSLQAVLDELAPHLAILTLSPAEQATLGDWDTPEDVARDH